MSEHKFRAGDRVKLQSRSSNNAAEAYLNLIVPVDVQHSSADRWEVTRLLPPDAVGAQYHIRSEQNGLHRLVYEDQLAPTQ